MFYLKGSAMVGGGWEGVFVCSGGADNCFGGGGGICVCGEIVGDCSL